ncbi:MAG: hypothetical protein AAGA90_16895 [Actinomycetota bacterium]
MVEGGDMQRTRHIAPVDLDLTDEAGLLAEDRADNDLQTTRARLAALNLRNPAQPSGPQATVFDATIYRVTGDRHLASLFGRAA